MLEDRLTDMRSDMYEDRQADLRLDMSSISLGMSLSLLLLRTRVSSLAILLMFSGSSCRWFLCSHSVFSISILRTNTETHTFTG